MAFTGQASSSLAEMVRVIPFRNVSVFEAGDVTSMYLPPSLILILSLTINQFLNVYSGTLSLGL